LQVRRVSSAGAESNVPPEARWGFVAPPFLRAVTLIAWFALLTRLVSTALPGSRSGIEPWIKRADLASSVLTQLSVLLGASLLVMLVVGTVAERGFRNAYRVVVVPAAAIVLMLVILASRMGLDAPATVFLGVSCLVLAGASAATALGAIPTRAQGMVLAMVTLACASRLAVRGFGSGPGEGFFSRGTWGLAIGSAFDVMALALAATRLLAERRKHGRLVLGFVLLLAGVAAWGALRGSLEGARTWQVIAARALSDLGASPSMAPPGGGVFALDALTVLLAGAIAVWPGRLSAGIVAIGLALLSRPGVDVPASALLLALGALAAPLGAGSETPAPSTRSLPGRSAANRESTASEGG
jgi:hypothetical protein